MSWEQPPAPRRDRRVAIGAVVAVVIVIAGLVTASLRSSPPSQLTVEPTEDVEPTGAAAVTALDPEQLAPVTRLQDTVGSGELLDGPPLTIVAADFSAQLQLVDTATGGIERIQLFSDPVRRRPEAVRVVGDSVIVDADGLVARIVDGEPQPVVLARGRRSIAGTDATSVWVYNGVDGITGGVVARLGFDGTVHDEIELATLTRPIVGTADGVLVDAPGTVRWIATDGSQREIAAGRVVASDGTRLARVECTGDRPCSVATGTIDDPDQGRVQLGPNDVPEGLFDRPQGLFSPDGRWLALPVFPARQGADGATTSVVVFDVALGAEALRIDGSALTQDGTPIAWSPDSRWLVVSTGSGLRAWSTETFSVTDLPVRLSPTYALAMR